VIDPESSLQPGTRDLLFPTTLQTHTHPSAPVHNDERSADDFMLSLKAAALLSRGIVVSDSDLNNNALLHRVVQEDGPAFLRAIRLGVVRRAVRLQDDAGVLRPARQAEVAAALAKNNPGRHALIPPKHVTSLDAAFNEAESRPETGPLSWTFTQLGTIFTSRLLKVVDDEARMTSPADPAHAVLQSIANWVRERVLGKEAITAAGLEEAKKRDDLGTVDAVAWDRIWPLVLNAYNGNVPAALDLTLGEPLDDPLRFLPAGPDSSGNELATELKLYAQPIEQARDVFSVEKVSMDLPDVLSRIRFDERRLRALDLAEVLELREGAGPDEFFALRHDGLGSAEKFEDRLSTYLNAAADYVERLMTRGSVLTRTGGENALTRLVQDGVGADSDLAAYFLRSNDPEILADQLLMCIADSQVLAPHLAMCDLQRVARMRPELNQEFERLGRVPLLVVSRPDYRIIQEFGEQLSAPGDRDGEQATGLTFTPSVPPPHQPRVEAARRWARD
jgi:hypothetical protein